jgi:hypothetical protein
VWFSTSCCDLGSFDPNTSTVSGFSVTGSSGLLSADVGAPNQLLAVIPGSSPAETSRYNVSSGAPVLAASTAHLSSGSNCTTSRFTPDGTKVLTACGSPYHIDEYDATTLLPTGNTYPTGAYPIGVRTTAANGGFVVAMTTGVTEALHVFRLGTYTQLAQHTLAGYDSPGMLALSPDGTTAYVVRDVNVSGGPFQLWSFTLP